MPRSIRTTLAASLARSLVVLLAACGGSDSPAGPGPGTTPPLAGAVASVAVSAASGTLRLGDSLTLGAITRDDRQAVLTGRVVRWTSSNPLVATVDSTTGVLTGVDRGTVTVTATSEGIRGTATRVVVIKYRSVGAQHVCAVSTESRGYCWGFWQNGELGRASTASSSAPVAIAGNLLLTSITAGSEYACAVTTAGAGQCWGYSGLGNLGDGGRISFGNTYVTVPQAVVGGHAFRALSASDGRTCGVTTADAVWCWGSNTSGQLGLVLGNGSNVPVRAGGSLLAAEVSAANLATGSASFTCAIADDRLTTFCWGRNDVGQLGNGATSTAAATNSTPSIVQGQKPLPRTR